MIRTKNIAVYEKYFKYSIVLIVSIFTILNFLSQRSFERSFTLSDEIHVKTAELRDGMLKIKLEKIIPDHKKPKIISIK